MKYGFVFPHYEMESDPIAIRDFVQAGEALGYDYVLAYDHVLGANPDRPGGWHGPYTYKHVFHELFVLFGYLAGLTQTLELATGIIILPQRQTALVAKQAAEVDVLSNGRLRLGIGIGWNKVEYDGLGIDFHKRGKRSEEQVVLLKELWTHELLTFKGDIETIDDAGINPLPVQRPIPLWFGGSADLALRRMARYGDGWMATGMPTQEVQKTVNKLHQYLTENNRQVADFGIDANLSGNQTEREAWIDALNFWQDLGATHLRFNTIGMGFTTADEHIAALRQFKEEIGF